MIDLYISHDPVAWTSPRLGRGICYSVHTKYKDIFRSFILSQYKGDPIKDYVKLDFVFYFPLPQSASNKKKELMINKKLFPTKSDCTNLQKFTEDCLKKIVIEDDRNVVQISSKKLYAFSGSIHIKIWTLEELKDHYESNS